MSTAGDFAKRALDVVASLAGLVVLGPVLLVVALAVKLDSPGPVFYSQTRVGLRGKEFRLHKFRTMAVGADKASRLTTAGDARVTRLGRFLRRSNLDELPQLLNVLKGEMSLVGPRPEVPEFVDLSDPRWLVTLSVRPGMTAPVTVEYRNEGEILATFSDPQKGYREVVLPRKLDKNVEYVEGRTLWKDLATIVGTVLDIAGLRRLASWTPLRLVPWRFNRHIKFALDVAAWTAMIPVAFYLRLESLAWTMVEPMLELTLLAAPLQALLVYLFGLHRQSWGVVGGRDGRQLGFAVATGTAILFAEAFLFQPFLGAPRSVPLIAGALAVFALGGMRMVVRWESERARRRDAPDGRRVLVVGAGEAGTLLVREMLRHPEMGLRPVGFLDDDPAKRRLAPLGVPVVGPLPALPEAFRAARADEALFAIPSANMAVRRDVFDLAARHGVPLRNVPSVYDILSSRTPAQVRDVLSKFVLDGRAKNVLLVGGGGYIGSALVPLLLERGYRVRVLDMLIYGKEPIEPYLDHPNFELVEGDFRQVNHVVAALQGIDTVIHLGAIVGDPACALDEELTVEVNLMATKMVAEVSKGYGVSRFIFASTCSVYGASDGILDESSALNPVSLYARTKIASEKVLLKMADHRFAPTILRFGTVYGFSGRTRFDLVVNTLTAKAITDGVVTLYGGDQWRPFVHVQDLGKALLMVVEAPAQVTAGRTFNVGSDEQNYTLRQVAEAVQKVVPNAVVVDKGLDGDRRNYRVSFRAIREAIGFRPDWTLELGIRQVAEALQSGRIKDPTMPVYSNVRYLTSEGLQKLVPREYASVRDILDEVPGAPSSPPVAR